jgi:hypothetical protein
LYYLNFIYSFRIIEDIHVISIDESMVEYHPSANKKCKLSDSGEPIPVVFIQRKPHPNGLLLYEAVTYVEHPAKNDRVLPFIVDMVPHIRMNDCSPIEVVKKVVAR